MVTMVMLLITVVMIMGNMARVQAYHWHCLETS